MTINDVEEMWSKASKATSSSDRKKFKTVFRRKFEITHSADATVEEIEAAPGISVGETYGTYPNVYCTQVGPVERVGVTFSRVPIEYVGEVGGPDNDDPVLQPPDYEYGSMSSEEETEEDAYGQDLTTTAGEPVHGLKSELHDMYLQVSKNYLAFSGAIAIQYLHSVNIDNFQVFSDTWSPGQAAMRSFKIKPIINPDTFSVDYFRVTCRIEFRVPYNTTAARAWWYRYRNEGFYARFDSRVTFSGGTGVSWPAAGFPIVSSGAITKIVITNGGRDYSTAPTVSVASDDGGTGFAGTAVLGTGDKADQVVSVTITNGGSGYKSGIERIVDERGEPVSKPQLLAANGSLLEDTSTPFYVERPRKLFYLNYTSLGLLD